MLHLPRDARHLDTQQLLELEASQSISTEDWRAVVAELSRRSASGALPATPPGNRPRSIACPSCGSGDVRKVSLVYEEGTTQVTGKTSSGTVGMMGGEIGVAASSGSYTGVTRTQLAVRIAPPPARNANSEAAVFMVMAWVLSFAVLSKLGVETAYAWVFASILAIAVAAFVQRPTTKWNREERPKAMEEWERKFLCRRCGEIYIPA